MRQLFQLQKVGKKFKIMFEGTKYDVKKMEPMSQWDVLDGVHNRNKGHEKRPRHEM